MSQPTEFGILNINGREPPVSDKLEIHRHVHDYERFLQELDKVWKECLRVLIPGGRLCIVVGDVCRARRRFGKREVIPLHADILVRCRQIGYEGLAMVSWHKIANAATEVGGLGPLCQHD